MVTSWHVCLRMLITNDSSDSERRDCMPVTTAAKTIGNPYCKEKQKHSQIYVSCVKGMHRLAGECAFLCVGLEV